MGLATYGLACGHFVGHAGGVNGTASIMMVDRKGERAVVAVINARGPVDPDVVGLADDLLCKTP